MGSAVLAEVCTVLSPILVSSEAVRKEISLDMIREKFRELHIFFWGGNHDCLIEGISL